MVRCYRDLRVWQRAMDLVIEGYGQRLGYVSDTQVALWLEHSGVLARMLSTLSKKLRAHVSRP
jgi:hypothetical protein